MSAPRQKPKVRGNPRRIPILPPLPDDPTISLISLNFGKYSIYPLEPNLGNPIPPTHLNSSLEEVEEPQGTGRFARIAVFANAF
jgi:hypothetical protein